MECLFSLVKKTSVEVLVVVAKGGKKTQKGL